MASYGLQSPVSHYVPLRQVEVRTEQLGEARLIASKVADLVHGPARRPARDPCRMGGMAGQGEGEMHDQVLAVQDLQMLLGEDPQCVNVSRVHRGSV